MIWLANQSSLCHVEEQVWSLGRHAGRWAVQTFISHPTTKWSYYHYRRETEKLLILDPFLTRERAQLQSHLESIDCGQPRGDLGEGWSRGCWGPGLVPFWSTPSTGETSNSTLVSGTLWLLLAIWFHMNRMAITGKRSGSAFKLIHHHRGCWGSFCLLNVNEPTADLC